jgi:hypothetical protein
MLNNYFRANDGTETTTTSLTIDLIEHFVLLPSMLDIKIYY